LTEKMDYQKMKNYERKITLLLDERQEGKLTDKEFIEQTKTLLQEMDLNLTHDELSRLITDLEKNRDERGNRILGYNE